MHFFDALTISLSALKNRQMIHPFPAVHQGLRQAGMNPPLRNRLTNLKARLKRGELSETSRESILTNEPHWSSGATVRRSIPEKRSRPAQARTASLVSHMNHPFKNTLVARCFAPLCLMGSAWAAEPIEFNRDVRPVLADKCFACHGGDAKSLKGELRLDLRERATAPAKSGKIAIVPGHAERSELMRRIGSGDPDDLMPPADSHKSLTQGEKQLLRRWIAEGAAYKDHWSFIRPQKVRPPVVSDAAWNEHVIDRFVYAAQEKRGMKPDVEADRLTLIRRVSLDLRGMPPSLEEIDAFTQDSSEGAFGRMVDRMLGSPRFGERMAMTWLDLARYGDTNGYHNDSDRPTWLWRDWVVDAFNSNMPFDQFTEWQLGGDLLPEASAEQKIASGFNRNTRFNEEGGADPAEFLIAYAADRAVTMSRVWLGLTLNCAQCHTHKYDPISHREFYQFTAFFNSMEEEGAGGVSGFHGKPVPPVMRVQTRQIRDELAEVKTKLAALEGEVERIATITGYTDPGFAGDAASQKGVSQLAWEEAVAHFVPPPAPTPTARWNFTSGAEDVIGDREGTLHGGAKIGPEGLVMDGKTGHVLTAPGKSVLEAKTLEAFVKLSSLQQAGGAVIGIQTLEPDSGAQRFDAIVFGERKPAQWMAGSDSFHRTQDLGAEPETAADKEFVHIAIAYDKDGTVRCYRNGKPYGKPYRKADVATFKAGEWRVIFGARALPAGSNFMLSGTLREARMYDRALTENEIAASAGTASPQEPPPVLAAIKLEKSQRTAEQIALLRDYYLRNVHAATVTALTQPRQDLATARARMAFLTNEVNHPLQMVSLEMPKPKDAFVLMRGDFQTPGEKVERDVPAFLPKFPADQPRNRLGLARWLMQKDQPLVARVQVNRFWQMCFGDGLVRSMGDFGLQGTFPSHPELLDWLALEFIDSGWNVKQLLKTILISRTYRQSSTDARRHAEADPLNTLLWRAPRVRLQAETIRDNALSAAGLLSKKMGGPPVYPWQPNDYYKGKNNGWPWPLSPGEDLYRRGLYTFWRRTTPYPTFVIFDAPDRAECTFERPRTNTPLQALATLNDPQFVEAARVLAQRVLAEGASTDRRITLAYRLTLSRPPTPWELEIMRGFLDEQLALYQKQPDSAKALATAGRAPRPESLNVTEHAAWTAFANVVLNLDETITRN